jgi:hypothetical protein
MYVEHYELLKTLTMGRVVKRKAYVPCFYGTYMSKVFTANLLTNYV